MGRDKRSSLFRRGVSDEEKVLWLRRLDAEVRQRDGFGSGFTDRLERFADPIFRQGPVDPLLVVRRVVAVDACR